MTETTTTDVVAFRDLTDFQKKSLLVIAGNDGPYGLEIKRQLEDYYTEEVNHGRLYPNLDTLEASGFITKGEIDKRTNSYTITEKGMAAIKNELGWMANILEDTTIDLDSIELSDTEEETEDDAEKKSVSASV